MTVRACRIAAAVAALLAAGRAAASLDLQLTLGAAYTRGDFSATGSPTATTTTWDFAGGLGVLWTPLSPGLLSLSGSASYADRTTAHFEVTEKAQNLAYQGTVSVSPGPLQLSFSGGRTQTDYSTRGETDLAGTVRVDTYTGVLSFSTAALPQLRALWFHSDQTSYFTGAPDSRASVDSLSVNVHHNVPTHAYNMGYGTSWSSGTRAQANYQNHALTVTADARPSPGVTVSLSDVYYLRDPTVSDPTNPRIDANSLSLRLSYAPSSRLTSSLSYGYSRSLGQAPGTLDQEDATHSVTASADYKFDRQWGLVSALGASYGVARLGTAHYQATGESLVLGANWSTVPAARQSLSLGANGSVGLSQPDAGSQLTTYGLSGSAFYTFPFFSWDGSAGYVLTFNDGSGALMASTLGQSLNASAGGSIWQGSRTTVRFQAQSLRSSSPVAGVSYGRSLNLTATTTWRIYTASIMAGSGDTLANDLKSGFSDGLFFSPGFNNRSRYLTLEGRASFPFRLGLQALLTYVWLNPAGGFATDEVGLHLVAGYTLGEWVVSLQDDFVYTSANHGPWTKSNTVYLRLGRPFWFHR